MRRIAGIKRKRQVLEPWIPHFLFVVRSYSTIHTSTNFLKSIQLFLLAAQTAKAVAIKDIDETLMYKVGLGGSPWFKDVETQVSADPKRYAALLHYYFAIQPHLRQIPTEACVPHALKMLQEKNIPVIGLTARSEPIADITIQKLEKLSIRFTSHSDEKIILKNGAVYYKGAIFGGGRNKAECFDAFLETPVGTALFSDVKHVSFMDDQFKYCEGMHHKLRHHGFFPTVTHYTHVEEKIPRATDDEILEDMRQLEKDHGIRPGW